MRLAETELLRLRSANWKSSQDSTHVSLTETVLCVAHRVYVANLQILDCITKFSDIGVNIKGVITEDKNNLLSRHGANYGAMITSSTMGN